MDKHERKTPPDAAATAAAHGLETRFAAELEFSLKTQGLQVRSKCSTIMLEAVLLDALGDVDRAESKTLPEDGVVLVKIDYDMAADRMAVETNCPRILAKGVLAHALGAVTRNQTAQNFSVYKGEMERRVRALEDRAGVPKIILPGD